MPARFVEVVDVAAEASDTLAQLFANGRGWAGMLSFNISDYLNATTGVDALKQAFAAYNATPDWEQLGLLGLAMNMTPAELHTPRGPARNFLSMGLLLLLTRELYIYVATRSILRRYGHHTNGRHFCAVNHGQ